MADSDEAVTVEFLGAEFRVADRFGLMPMMRFAKVAQSGADSMSMAGLASMYDLLAQSIHPDDWARFEAHADEQRADGDQLMTLVGKVIALASGRPTSRPSDSSDGSPTTSASSADDSASQVIADMEEKGRPDLALIVQQAQESMASA